MENKLNIIAENAQAIHENQKAYVDNAIAAIPVTDKKLSNSTSNAYSDNAISYGDKNCAGYMCHKVISYDSTNLTLTLDSDASTLAINDEINIDGGNLWPYCAKITAINGNVITVDRAIVSYLDGKPLAANPSSKEDHLLYVDGKSNTGTHILGSGQTSTGINNAAVAIGTVSLGKDNIASGRYAVAIGRQNVAAPFATAIGRVNKARGMMSTSLGYRNTIDADWGYALGSDNKVSGKYAGALGTYNTVSGANSLAINEKNTASGGHSFAGGRNSIASKTGSFAFGYDIDISGTNYPTTASNNGAVAFGLGTTASGHASFSAGYNTKASGHNAVAFGSQTKAFGNNSFTSGAGSQSSVECGNAMGRGVVAANVVGQTVVGRFNDYSTAGDAIFVVGNGTSASALSNAFRVMSDGSAKIQTMGTSDNSVATKKYVDDHTVDLSGKMDKFGDIAIAAEDFTMVVVPTNLDLRSERGYISLSSSVNSVRVSDSAVGVFSDGNVDIAGLRISMFAGRDEVSQYSRLLLDNASEHIEFKVVNQTPYEDNGMLSDPRSAGIDINKGVFTINATGGVNIHNVVTPTEDGDAANKKYVDSVAASNELSRAVIILNGYQEVLKITYTNGDIKYVIPNASPLLTDNENYYEFDMTEELSQYGSDLSENYFISLTGFSTVTGWYIPSDYGDKTGMQSPTDVYLEGTKIRIQNLKLYNLPEEYSGIGRDWFYSTNNIELNLYKKPTTTI